MSKSIVVWRAVFVVLVLVALLLALVPYDVGIYQALGRRSLDAGHFFAFGVLALVAYGGLLGGLLRRRTVRVVVLSAGLAVALEVLQGLGSRSASLGDVVLDMSGVAAFLAVYRLWGLPLWRWAGVAMFGLICLVVLCWPAAEGYRIWAGRHHLPVLGDFETLRDALVWRSIVPGERPTASVVPDDVRAGEGRYALSVRTQSGLWSGVEYYGYGADWSGYEALGFDLYNPDEAFPIGIRVDDTVIHPPDHEDRYNRTLQIRPGWNSVRLTMAELAAGPAKRRLDVSRIYRLLIFVGPGQPPRHFYLDNVRLE